MGKELKGGNGTVSKGRS